MNAFVGNWRSFIVFLHSSSNVIVSCLTLDVLCVTEVAGEEIHGVTNMREEPGTLKKQ